MFSLSSPVHLRARVGLTMKYSIQSPNQCVWCFPQTAVYWNRKDHPIIFRTSNSFRQLELKSAATGRSLYNVFENHNKEDKPSLVKAMEKDTEAVRKMKEEERRRKIGLANRGKVPWNKGRKHTEDTRRRIKQRTIEALRNPKVRDKMSVHQQPHSDETKEKIRASVKQVWAERYRTKRLKEMFTSLWSENIAEAARKGGTGEVELGWDSYETSKQEISSEQRQLAEEKARTKEQTKMRAEEAKTEKMRRVVERKRDQREVKTRKPKQNKENATVTSRSKLKKRLTKIHKKKTSLGKVSIVKDRVVSVAAKLENLDLELIRKEITRGEISLADQIRAAKSLRGNDGLSRIGVFAMTSVDFD